MRSRTNQWFACTILSTFLIVACVGTGTKLTQTQMDENRQKKPVSNILVLGVTYKEKEEIRRSFEDSFVVQLRAVGVEAVSSGNAISIPTDLKLEKDEILKAVHKFNNDAILITYVTGKDEKEDYTRGYSGYYGHYGWAYGYAHIPSYSSTNTFYRLATKLYDAETEKLIWSGISETLNPDSTRQMIDDVVKVVIKDLQKNNLIPQK